MKSFEERNPVLIGTFGVGLTLAIVLAALNYDKLPFVDQTRDYSAHFAEAGGLVPDADVQISGMRVGLVESVGLDGPRVVVKFSVDEGVHVGDRSEAAIKTKTILGAKFLELAPRGQEDLTGPIPINRTSSVYQLPDALGDLTMTISGLNTTDLSESLRVLSTTFKDTPPALKVALDGVSRFSETLNRRDEHLRRLLDNAEKATAVLAERSDQVVSLVADTNALLAALLEESAALDQISGNISAFATELKGFISENRDTLSPAVDKLNGVLTVVDNRKAQLQKIIKQLGAYLMSLGEAASSGPFFNAYIMNLLPGQFLQPFVDAAFSDLGLDPLGVAPSERSDPQVGQPGTPALPVPFPRTGQGGDPRLTIPDAITGNPGDQPCGLPGLRLPGPGCYPYREPPPPPPPGGPPPGPPALSAPGMQSTPEPVPSSVLHLPGEPAQPAAEAGGQR